MRIENWYETTIFGNNVFKVTVNNLCKLKKGDGYWVFAAADHAKIVDKVQKWGT